MNPSTFFSKVLAPLVLSLTSLGLCAPALADNDLAVGRAAKFSGYKEIPVNPPIRLNFRTRDEILTLRKAAVQRHKLLLEGDYEASEEVFGAIEDGKPWWGLAGSCVFGRGNRSIDGLAEESRFIMNPYILVAAGPGSLGIWNKSAITQQDVNDPNFPYTWQPERVRFDARNLILEVYYDVTDWHKKAEATGKLTKPVMISGFSLVAYNARDFGYNYIYIEPQFCVNVVNEGAMEMPIRIKQFIHCGGSCGYGGGCNNMSPFTAEMDRLKFTKLPARAVVYLWKNQPPSAEHPADMRVVLNFR